jgi:hypothetical protein
MSERVIYKYRMESIEMCAPLGHVLLVAAQNNHHLPTLWIEHNFDRSGPKTQTYVVCETGGTPPPDSSHVGSCVCGEFVWHVYIKW